MTHHYIAYGLQIATAFPCPEMMPCEAGQADVHIGYGQVPESLENPAGVGVAWQAAPGRFLMDVHGVARYLVSAGKHITIEPAPDIDEADIRVFLLGSVMAALLIQRGLLTLHASAIRTDQGAVVFMGKSGSGKSTLLAALLKRGYAMMADDVVGIALDDQKRPLVLPAFPYTRLWHDTATVLHYPVEQNQRLRQDMDKYVLPVDHFPCEPLPLRTVYALTLHNKPHICMERAAALDVFNLLQRFTYRKRFIRGLGQDQHHFQLLTAVAETTRANTVIRPVHPVLINELADRIEEDLA